jgi:hypothetical protein
LVMVSKDRRHLLVTLRSQKVFFVCLTGRAAPGRVARLGPMELSFSEVNIVPGDSTDEEEHEEPGRVQGLGGHEVHDHHVHEGKEYLKFRTSFDTSHSQWRTNK